MRSVAWISKVQPLRSFSLCSSEKHRERVGLFAGGAAGAPDFQFFEADFAAGFDEFGKDDVLQGGELRLAAEEAGFADGDFVEKFAEFDDAGGGAAEKIEILARVGGFGVGSHAAFASAGEEIEFFFGVVDAAGLIDEVANFRVDGIASFVVAGRGDGGFRRRLRLKRHR